MNAGRELDAIIAEKVMGWHLVPVKELCAVLMPPEITGVIWDDDLIMKYQVPPYSTDIAAAWQVVEKIADTQTHFHAQFVLQRELFGWGCGFRKLNWSGAVNESVSPFIIHEHCQTAPHAICLAALKAVGYDPTPSP